MTLNFARRTRSHVRTLPARSILAAVGLLAAILIGGVAHAAPSSAQVAWRLLDYIAVDYSGAVADGKVVNDAEYQEMVEFAAAAKRGIGELAATAARASLIAEASALETAISEKREPAAVAGLARGLASRLLAAYPVPLSPTSVPDLARGAALYAEQCAACHGTSGNGRGPAAASLDPPPIDFTDIARARERSLFGLYQVIDQGLDGTSMASFSHLTASDKWALAFYVGGIAFPNNFATEGKAIWQADPDSRRRMTLEQLATMNPAALAADRNPQEADALTAYLRRNPAAVAAGSNGGIALAQERLRAAEAAYLKGSTEEAHDLALSAYLDGFEAIEPTLAIRDAKLLADVEAAMAQLRSSISSNADSALISSRVAALQALLTKAENTLRAGESSSAASFFGSLTILLREGLEALLLVVSMIAFLRKAERGDSIKHVHAGWIAALLAGVATWGIATTVISFSGASRELTEGFGSVLAALVLLWVGIWMHGKSQANAWMKYIRGHMGRAVGRGSAWFLFGLSFLVVYREVFETILFYAALWEQGEVQAITGGAIAAVAILAVIAVAMLKFSRRLPITQFFAYSSLLIAVLAVVLIGKGVAALQEAGLMSVTPLASVPRVEILGVFPSLQSLGAQVAMAVALAVGFVWTRRQVETAK